ncbi:MAG: hypothetical protein IPL65_22390 [Lewinellaceae bacterium]|nr:hypothetical protein [Lewinellaceae bacterium]
MNLANAAPIKLFPTVTADCPVTATCSPVSGSDFPAGVTTVTCTATDKPGKPGHLPAYRDGKGQ